MLTTKMKHTDVKEVYLPCSLTLTNPKYSRGLWKNYCFAAVLSKKQIIRQISFRPDGSARNIKKGTDIKITVSYYFKRTQKLLQFIMSRA